MRAWKTTCPPLSGEDGGKDFVIKINLFPPKGGEKVLVSLYKINIKKVLIYN